MNILLLVLGKALLVGWRTQTNKRRLPPYSGVAAQIQGLTATTKTEVGILLRKLLGLILALEPVPFKLTATDHVNKELLSKIKDMVFANFSSNLHSLAHSSVNLNYSKFLPNLRQQMTMIATMTKNGEKITQTMMTR